ncbi:tubulin-specific chaperone cofactor E-like protein isoform X2 [Biomphalaria pfeifferi]|uniref:Tubulin-specific chaperone cofactor E-like protein isoform X2 n=1 Tax=Biomphalaria pfeifferi TaxID=112525 RepID=A0AAD8C488_BIOPF|nr:tubulin-specific chaperone cofactor E-like protein isoform X2 [Biomphalaria pfeifferi]
MRAKDKRTRRRKKSFTEALKEKYCAENEPTFDFIIISPKRRNNTTAELGHLQTVVLNEMNVTRADIPCHGLMSLCPNIVDLDLANNLLDKWTELLAILSNLPKVKYVNVSRNSLRLNPDDPLPESNLSVENLALNDTGVSLDEIAKLSSIMPMLKELHLCGNNYENLSDIDERIRHGAFSSLECLRLNNNSITSWSEVWKLRHLPHLKFLVLSGNPIKDIFYECSSPVEQDGRGLSEQNNTVLNIHKTSSLPQASLNNSEPATSNVTQDRDFMKFSHAFCGLSVLDTAKECGSYPPFFSTDASTNDDVTEEADVFDDGEDCKFLDSRQSDSDDISDKDRTDSDSDDALPHMFDSDFSANNSNVSRSKAIAFAVNSGFDFRMSSYSTSDSSKKSLTSIHRPVQDLNSKPDFEQNTSDKNNHSLISVENIQNASSEFNVSIQPHHPLVTSKGFDANEIKTLLCRSIQEQKMSNIMQDFNADSFTPRAVLLNDESFMLAPLEGDRTLDSKVQRCLFRDIPDCNEHSDQPKCLRQCYDCIDSLRPHNYSESDSCSDIESEQQKYKHANHLTECLYACAFDKKGTSENVSQHSCSCSHQLQQTSSVDSSDLTPPQQKNGNQKQIPCNHGNTACQQSISSGGAEHSTETQGTPSTAVTTAVSCAETKQCLKPFENLQILCLSNAELSHHNHLKPFMLFPKLTNLRLKNNPLYSSVHGEDRRKLYIASLPTVNILNGSEISSMEREKAERHYLRYYMDKLEKPDFYHTLVKKHGPPVKLVDIDLSAGYQEWATLKFICDGAVKFTRRIHLVDPVSRLRNLIAAQLALPKRCFVLYHHACGPSHPESERELTELRCESLPMSRFDFAEGDEIHIDVRG